MIPAVIMIALFILAFVLIVYTGNKSENVLIVFLMLCGVVSAVNTELMLKKAIFAGVALVFFCIIRRVNVNKVINSSNYIYLATVILLVVALTSGITVEGASRYVFVGDLAFAPAPLAAFSILPICKFINRMKRIAVKELLLISFVGGIQMIFIFLLPDIELALMLCMVYLIMLVKVKADNRINVSWMFVLSAVFGFVSFCTCIILSRPARFLAVLSRGMSDADGAGFQLHSADMALKAVRFIGQADISHLPELQIVMKMPITGFAVKFGWLCVMLLIIAFAVLVIRLYYMSAAIKNSFAKYACFGIASYFTVSGVYHIIIELVAGYYRPLFIFMGNSMNFIIHAALLGIAFLLYEQRNKIKVGRQLDIDYDMTDEILKGYEHQYKSKLKTTDKQDDIKSINDSISELRREREQWQCRSKTLKEINQKYDKYEKELGISATEKNLVFISYNHFDERYAEYLAEQIENLGLKAWHFKRDMKPQNGINDYAVAIHRAIRQCRVFVVILSHHSMNSEHVKNEVCLAFNQISKGTTLMGVSIENVSIDDDETMDYYLCRKDITSAVTPPVKKHLNEFAKKIESVY